MGRYRFGQWLGAIRAIATASVTALHRQPGERVGRAEYDQASVGLGGGSDVEAGRKALGERTAEHRVLVILDGPDSAQTILFQSRL